MLISLFMKNTERFISCFHKITAFLKSRSWPVVLPISCILGVLAISVVFASYSVLQSKMNIPIPAEKISHVPPVRHFFAPERLEAFSGHGFNLRPNLAHFLDKLEESLRVSHPEITLSSRRFRDYQRFINTNYVTLREYIIKSGDNFWKIGKKQGYTVDTIVGCNPHMEKIVCYTRQRILLPSRGGSLHMVKSGETLSGIALDYAVEASVILAANHINREWGVIPGMWLFISGAKPRYLDASMRQLYSKRALFRSPLCGRYTSFVGNRIHPVLGFSKFHNGIDIACPMRTWVGASAAGTVVTAGWGGAIGKYIKIDHHNGYMTMYGHLSKINVRKGRKVRRGQLIARSGSTGRVTGPHLHYTIWKNGRVVDPMDYLW